MNKSPNNSRDIIPMSELVSASRGDLLDMVSTAFEQGRKAYVVAAKCCIAIAGTLSKGETFYGVLEAAGLSKSQIANGRQLAQVYETWVSKDGTAAGGEYETGGKMTEEQFDSLNFTLAVALNKLTRKNPRMAEAYLSEPEEWQCLADNGMTTSAYNEFKAKEAEAEAARKADQARIQSEAEKLTAQNEAAAEAQRLERESESGVTEAEEEHISTEPEPSTEVSAEVEAPEVESSDAPPVKEEEVESKPEGNVVAMDRMPALLKELDRIEEIAIEIARDQPDSIEAARSAIDKSLGSISGILESLDTESEQKEAVNS